ncbi:hypothetical protein Bhyg_08043 [Pseudolycoriella hygida]|uniref:Uncharacterized protein n=1 Tax=Pseudolycoriella hygida TaxID=35572 RepID=A0A9Q0N3X1_9DIPT|nr:hypothetical protein Bhyg_08043 [Pseudolycoriella hygida]
MTTDKRKLSSTDGLSQGTDAERYSPELTLTSTLRKESKKARRSKYQQQNSM